MRQILAASLLAVSLASSPSFAQIPLGTAQNFGALGGSAVTNTGPTVVTRNVGVSPGSSVTGFPPGVVIGTIHSADATSAQAQTDLTTAYNAASGIPCNTNLTGQNLGGLTLTPGVYCFDSSAALTGTLTLDLQGNADAFFLFKIGSTLTTASGSAVVLVNSAGSDCPPNLFWQVGSSATFGTGSSFIGNVLALTSITLTTGADLNGRALARNGAVTLDTNTISPCGAIVVCPAITVNPATLPNGTAGVPYNQTITATGGEGPYSFTITAGNLPTGLTLNPVSGQISGIPAANGNFSFTVTAEDTNSCAGSRSYDLAIVAAAPQPAGIPTIDFAGMAMLVAMLVGVALFVMNRAG